MATLVRFEQQVRVRCCDCGSPLFLTERQARRREQQHRCSICVILAHHGREPVEDRHRRYWLERFSDEEIARLASEMLGEDVPTSRVQERWNRTTLGV